MEGDDRRHNFGDVEHEINVLPSRNPSITQTANFTFLLSSEFVLVGLFFELLGAIASIQRKVLEW